MFATIQGWPASRLPIDHLRAQVTAVGGEIIVVDGSDRPPPAIEAVRPGVTWISRPGESVYQLRAAGYEHCRGEIVAVTEDHVEPAADWCERILAAHAAHPEAVAIGGAVENATTAHLVDQASFIMVQVHSVGPFAPGPAERIAGAANVSYKRAVLDRRPDHGDLGVIEVFDTAQLRRPGEVLLNDDTIRVRHHQCLGVAASAALEFHNGRTIAGFRRGSLTTRDLLRILGLPVLPLYRTARTAKAAWATRIPRSATLISLPLQVVLQYALAAGEVVGYVAGAGSSPHRLR
jgi:hypothetical protein